MQDPKKDHQVICMDAYGTGLQFRNPGLAVVAAVGHTGHAGHFAGVSVGHRGSSEVVLGGDGGVAVAEYVYNGRSIGQLVDIELV